MTTVHRSELCIAILIIRYQTSVIIAGIALNQLTIPRTEMLCMATKNSGIRPDNRQTWPEGVELQTQVWGSHHDLEKTGSFIMAIDLHQSLGWNLDFQDLV